ncbi:ecdysone 20-monooxygenase [Anopheles bellator]|uniref:ecdysone 20-monooxygenase n=1 Tax=Anopheles bellator TaxID=139047 RepID=UPI00264A473D|nr:ecdysone 20-monooxygenase [Anopheles bellator]
MSVTIVLFYTFVTLFMFLSYNPKPKKIIESIRSFLLHLLNGFPTDCSPSSSSSSSSSSSPSLYGDQDRPQVPQVKSIWNIPGPRRLPLIGTKWLYLTGRQRYSKVHEAFLELHRRYGKIVLDVDTVPIVNLFDRADMERVLKYPSRFPFRPPTEIIETYRRSRPDRFGVTNLINAQGEKWHELRMKLTSGITSRRILQSFIPSVNDICDDFVDLVRRQRAEDGTIRNFQDIANSVGLEIICCLVLGRRMGYLTTDRRNEKFIRLAEAVKESFVYISQSYYGFKLWKYMPTRLYRNFVRCEEIIYDTIAEIVYEALEEEQLNCPDNDVKHIFISILQSEGLETKEKISGIIDLITSAIETLSNTLSFLLHNLSQSADHQRAIAQEFAHCAKSITNDDLVTASFTKACIQESYRISPTTPCLARILEEDYHLSGYSLPAGTLVLCHTRVACQSEENFQQADQFLPERWLDQRDENHNVYKRQEAGAGIVLPFGTGRRMCPGQKIVDIELTLLVAKIFQNFEIEYRSPLDTQFQFLLAPRTPIEVRFRDRT